LYQDFGDVSLNSSLQVVIMAGGSGTRFWPYSTPELPKQFLDLTGEGTMMQLTVKRLKALVPTENIWVLTNAKFSDLVCEQCPELLKNQVVGEPMARDTSAAVALGAGLVHAKDPNAVMAVLPADHMIRDESEFVKSIEKSVALAEESRFVTLGIEPSYAAEIYGYLQAGEALGAGYALQRFVEKPKKATAEGYLKEGGYYWNAGMFVWKAEVIMSALAEHLPEHAAMAKELGNAWGAEDWASRAASIFEPLEKISIDFGLMEKLSDIAMVPASFDWNDVGGWAALKDLLPHDDTGNTIGGANVIRDAQNNIIVTQNGSRPTLVAGVSNCVIVNADAGTMVCSLDEIERVKDLIEKVLAL
jgi:mannose-1-phosphate guanylyltransferase